MISIQEMAAPAAYQDVGRTPAPAQSALFAGAQPVRSARSSSETGRERDSDEASKAAIAWTHADVVMLHAILFDTCVEQLSDPETPLDEVIDCLRWIFSGPGKEARAFSFATTLKLYARAPAWRVREAMQAGLARYLNQRLARYPAWVAEAFWRDPDRFAEELERNPQWVNETLRRRSRDGDLFAA